MRFCLAQTKGCRRGPVPEAGRALIVKEKTVAVDEILATFSSHITKSYPSPEGFRKNFNLLLKGKRERLNEEQYAASLEKNIVFLNELVSGGEALIAKLLDSPAEDSDSGVVLVDELNKLERRAQMRTAGAHRDAFVEGKRDDFKDLLEERKAGGAAYVERLEFNYRYLMTLRIFLYEFLSVLNAVRSEYHVSKLASQGLQRVRNHIEVTAHYYLGNVAVMDTEAGEGDGPADPVH